jgi:hypothetical protein
MRCGAPVCVPEMSNASAQFLSEAGAPLAVHAPNVASSTFFTVCVRAAAP